MGLHETLVVWTDREPSLDEELRALSEKDAPEMVNLPPDWKGVLATLFISTAMGQQGPRVKVYLKAGRGQPSASIWFEGEGLAIADVADFATSLKRV